jgi:eukaryotic-like serine/threonine-protein kinase
MESTAVVNERYQVVLERTRSSLLTDDLPAEDLLLGRNVLFRALKPDLSNDKEFVEKFRKQVQTAAGLTHPNIVAVYDWGREKNGFADREGPVYFIITERQNGRSVQSYIEEKGALPTERAIHIMLGASSAIGYAHRNGAVHGGLRPELVTVSPSGLVKVGDFGMARLIRTGDDIEIARWDAPEMINGEPATERTDVYALGELLYLLVTGRAPFTTMSVDELRRKQLNGVPAAPRKVNAAIPRALEVIIGRCLAKQPADRFASVNDLRAALVRLRESLGGTGDPARPAVPAAGFGTEAVGPDEPTRIDIPPIRVPVAPVASSLIAPNTPPVHAPAASEPGTATADEPSLVAPVVTPRVTPAVSPPVSPPVAPKPTTPAPVKAVTQSPKPSTSAFDEPTVMAKRPTFDRSDDTDTTSDTTSDTGTTKVSKVIGASALINESDPLAVLDKHRSGRRWVALFVGLLLVLAGLLGLLAKSLKDTTAETVVVPNVVNLNRLVAEEKLSNLGLTSIIEYATNEKFGRDVVFDQNPLEGRQVQAGTEIKLTVSSGDGVLRVPDVVGRSRDVAESTLRAKGFEPKVETRPDASAAPGNVIEQTPTADSPGKAGDVITIIVADRTGTGKVPDVTGKTPAEAAASLIAEGFRSNLLSESSVSVAKGTVIRTEPVAGKEFDRNGTVRVFVSGGASVSVPSVFGQTEGAAIATLRALGFEVDRQTKLVADPTSIGIVLDQTPKQGTESVSGAKVVLIVGELDPSATTTTTEPTGGKATILTTTTNPSDSPLDPTSLPPKTAQPEPTTPIETVAPSTLEITVPPTNPPPPPSEAPPAVTVPLPTALPPIPVV